ncbi:MAG: SpaA isopeptide-forming pilin-related protein [Porcincola intestinalis]|uniref:SpaA isopeptide-forming pilin-related protein n=1 Tax=Porcincola intestinalis TaxID=2606632 RepID=UPI002A91C54F|nr:SpaA isopeptide-forming pilin-related protein [Porcincola intestinalis]MDY5331591.1 SpaA isopeptide-forming pilin-related protein [Porcincola intestinalis]
MSIGKRFTSIMLSAAMLAGNMISPMSAYAGEAAPGDTGQIQSESAAPKASGQGDMTLADAQSVSEMPEPDTEEKDFKLILSVGDGYSFTYDQNHFSEEDEEKKKVTLLYKAGDEVDLDLFAKDGYQLDKVSFTDKEKINPQTDQLNVTYQEVPYTWKDEDTLIFTMPDKDIWMQTEYHQLQSEIVAGPESSQATPDVLASASDSAQGNESLETSPNVNSEQSVMQQNGKTQEENTTNAEISTQQDKETVSSIEADGYPADGSLMMLPEMEIGIDETAIEPKDKFEDVTYPQDTCKSSLISDEVKYGTPGLYSAVYRVDESTTGKKWYVVQPVRVSEARNSEKQAESSDPSTGQEAGSEKQTEDGSSEDNADPDPAPSAQTETAPGTEAAAESDLQMETELSDETESVAGFSEETEQESESLDETEADTESDTEADGGTYQVILKEGSEYNVTLDHEDGYYKAGDKVVVKSDIDAASTNIAAWRMVNHNYNDTGDFCEVTYDPQDDSNSFIMPAEDVELSVSRDVIEGAAPRRRAARRAAAADDDSDGGWNDQTDVEAGNYYYHSDGDATGHIFNNDLGYGGGDSYKWVRYKVNGVTYDVMAYCMQHNLHSPASGTTYTKMTELVEGGDDKYLRKAMFYGYGGPGWKGTFDGYSIKAIFDKYGVGKNAREMQHYLVDYLYDGSSGFGGALSTKGKNLLKECKAALKQMPDPANTSISPAISVTATSKTSPSFTWNADPAFVITINLENGVSLVNEATGAVSTGNGQIAGGQSFHFLATADNTAALTGKYTVTGNYPLDFHAMVLKLKDKQDIGFGYRTKNSSVTLSVKWPTTTPVSVQKASSNTTLVSGNRMYSLTGTAFTLANADHSYSFTIREDGGTDAQEVYPGTYTLHEASQPKGYKTAPDQTVTIEAGASGQVLPVVDEPLYGSLNDLVRKIPAVGYATTRPTAGAQFTVNYYDNPEPEANAKQTWVIQALPDGNGNYTAKLDQTHLVSGNLIYGENTIPLGCITVQETKAPEGYQINNTVWKLQILQSGNGVIYSSTTQPEIRNVPADPEELGDIPTFGDLKLGKISAEQETTPDGDASFKRAVFEVINANDFDVVLNTDHEKAIHPGEVATTITTGDDGTGQTTGNLLQTGKYTVREKTAPEGYTLSDKPLSVTIVEKQLADYSEKDPHANIPQRAGFKVQKKDLELAEKLCTLTDKTGAEFRADQITPNGNVIQGEAKLEGAVFDLINRSASSVVVDAKTYQPGDKIRSFTTDENGEFSSPASKDVNGNPLSPEQYLPYGTYELIETKAPEGFNLRGKNLDVTFTVRAENQGTMKDLGSISAEDDVIRFDVDIHKVQSELNEEDPQDKLQPMEGIRFDIYLDADMDGETPKEGTKPYVSIETNSEGYATTKDEAYPHGRLPYGHYTIIENKDTVPKGFGTIRNLHVNGTKDAGIIDGQLIQAGIYQDQHGEWIQLAKIDKDSGKSVLRAGAEIQVLKDDQETVVEFKDSSNHKKVSTFITNEEGMAYLPQRLEAGTYYLKELKAPYGYVLNTELTKFEVDQANTWDQLITWQEKDQEVKGVLKITKTDAETKKKIAGAKFGIYADEKIISGDGTVQAEKGDQVDTVVIGADGTGQSRELYLGKYHAAEIEAPEGYTLDPTEHPFELVYKDQVTPVVTVEIETENKPTTVKLTKYEWSADKNGEWTDDTPTRTLDGVTFDITRIGGADADRNRAGEVYAGGREVTKDDGTVIVKYVETGIYSITETATLPGYVLDDTLSYFTVDENGYVFMSDEKGNPLDGQEKSDKAETMRKDQYTRWDFSKVDMNGEELKGAKMQVLDAEGNVAVYQDDKGKEQKAEWTSDGTPHRISRLPLGNYMLHEEQSIKGYTLATDIPFEVTNTGVLCKVTMTNKKLIVKKLDVLGNGVKKAGLEIYEIHFHEDGTKYLSDQPVEAWKSDGKQYDTSNLKVGHTYRLIESKVPKGYVEAEPIDFTITDDLTDQTVTMIDKKVLVSKVNTKITMIAGAKLEVRDSEEQVVDYWTSDGTAYPVSGLKAGQTYTLVETEAPEGYVLADPIEFTVTKNWFADDSFELTNTQVFMSKTDVTGEKEVPGATLTVTDKETGKEVDKWVSGEEPHAISGLHVGGSYTLHEEIAAEGYVRASDIDFTVDDGFTVKTVKMVDKQVTMTKTDVTGEKEVPGAQMTVTEKETGKAVDTWTSGNEAHPISGLEVGKTYTLTEVTAPEGYAVAESIKFTVPDDGQNQTLSMKDKRVTIDKLDVLGNPVAGAKLAVYELTEDTKQTEEGQSQTEQTEGTPAQIEETQAGEDQLAAETGTETAADVFTGTDGAEDTAEENQKGSEPQESKWVLGQKLDSWVSDGKAHAVSGLIIGHTYRLVEESAPEGFAIAQPRDFIVTKEDADQKIALIDRQILVSKVDTEITMIAGAHLQVVDQDGKIIDNWVSDGTAHAVSGLVIGQTYKLIETEAPEGYVLASPFEFTVSDQADANDQLNLVNKQVKITKTDLTGEKEVEGAHLSVVEKETGKTADTWTSGKEAHPVSGLEVGKTYILTETRPADGYVTAESIEFTVEDDFRSETHQMKDDVTKLKISKEDITNSKELPGAQLAIKDSEGNEVEKWTSAEEPHYIEMLPIGTYTLTEIAPPALYMKAEDVQFEVKDTGEIQTVTMLDKPTTVVIHKKDIVDGENGEELPGAKLEVRDSTGKVIDSWTSGTTPHEIAYLTPGTYTLTEVTAPSGYDVAENVSFSVADNGEVQHVTMYDAPKEEKIDLTGKKKTTTESTPSGGGSYPTGGSTPTAPVRTGDNSPILLYLGILGAAAAGIVLLLIWKKRKENDSEE